MVSEEIKEKRKKRKSEQVKEEEIDDHDDYVDDDLVILKSVSKIYILMQIYLSLGLRLLKTALLTGLKHPTLARFHAP